MRSARVAPWADSRDIRGIQYLRGIAALMVVAHHARHYFPAADQWTSIGSRGVDIFFVISGFVMAHTTCRPHGAGDAGAQARAFLVKRFIRVVLLYWLALLWTTKRDLLAAAPPLSLWKDFLFVPHFHAIHQGAIYPALVPGWTINYEIFFYALFAASLALRTASAGRNAAIIGALAALALLGLLPFESPVAIFYTSSVVLEFGFGVLVHAALRRWPNALSFPVAAAVSAASLALLAVENDDRMRGVCDGPLAALLVWSFVQWSQRFDLRTLHALGDASYSIYLFHLAALAMPTWILRSAGVVEPTAVNVATVIVSQVLVAALSGLVIHRLLEKPLLRILRRPAPRAQRNAWASSAT